MSSTLMSTDMNVTRSTTRRHAPPGGHSSVSFGDGGDERPQTAPPAPMAADSKPPVVPSSETQPHLKKQNSLVDVTRASMDKKKTIGIAISTDVMAIAETQRQVVRSTLRASGFTNLRLYEVYDVQQLPAACEWLITDQNCVGVLAMGSLLEDNFASGHLCTSISQALTTLSSSLSVPVVPALLFAANEEAAMQTVEKSSQRAANGIAHLLKAKDGDVQIRSRTGHVSSESAHAKMAAAALASGNAAGVPASTLELLKQLKQSIKAHGARGIVGLGRKFRIMDDDRSGELDLDEFKKAISEHACDWTDEQISEVHSWFDEDNSGGISYEEFLFGLRGEMNERRAQLVLQAFAIMDTDKSGSIEVSDLYGRYDASQHPKVISGEKTPDEALREFLDTFDYGERDGKVTPDEWCKYYGHVSMSIDEDDYFELMIRNAWHISGGEGACANSSCRRVLVTHADGRQTVEEIKNDLGIAKDDKEAMLKNLQEQGIEAVGIDLFGSSDNITPPKEGKAHVAVPAAHQPHAQGRKHRHAPGGASSFTFG